MHAKHELEVLILNDKILEKKWSKVNFKRLNFCFIGFFIQIRPNSELII